MNINVLKINRESSISLNVQLYRAIKNAIQSGQFKSGEQCPTEKELMDHFHISRSVIQSAYTSLMEQNIIHRIRGRGTFVVEKSLDLDFKQVIQPMVDLIEKHGHKASLGYVHKEVMHFDYDKMGNLELNPEDKVLEVTRIFLADQEPVAYFKYYYPLKLFKDIEHFDFSQLVITQPLHKTYANQFSSNFRSIFAVNLSDDVTHALKLPKKSAGFKVHTLSYCKDGTASSSTTYYLKGYGINLNLDFHNRFIV